jgi:hypothetical protein
MASVETRRDSVVCGRSLREILVAAFPLASGGEVLFQLADEGTLRRGGVYVRARGGGEARAPRFDELFRDVAAKAREPRLARALRPLVVRAQRVARATRPRLTPAALRGIERLAAAGAKLDVRFADAVPGLPADAALLALALVFASEEERYPRPRYRGSDVAVERVLELISRRA